MELNLQPSETSNIIRSVEQHADGYTIHVGNAHYASSVILTSESVEMWHPTAISTLTLADFEHLAKSACEVLILGTGNRIEFPSPAITKPLMDQHIGLEVMDTPAACRTYNLLRADGRSVVAALFL